MKPKLLITDDDEEIRTQMKWALNKDYDVVLAEDRPSAINAFKTHRPPVVLLDLGLPPDPASTQEGVATLEQLLGIDPHVKVIIVTGQADRANAIKAVGEGAYDFLTKPVEMDELKFILKRAYHVASLEREYREHQYQAQTEDFEGMLGSSPQMQQVFSTIRKVATTEAPVLILGESGTGKEMAALAIHRRSTRRDGPFIAINCGAIPENLLESELFGHEKGAFTGAHTQREGRIEMAHGGTLFLDEVGELAQPLQVKLLRFLQERCIERVGGRTQIQVDTRIIAATNADLKEAIQLGTFREDLYYRLAVVTIEIPPLRERQSDVIYLAQVFLARFTPKERKTPLRFDDKALRALQRHTWPGNVRELENRVKRAAIMAASSRVSVEDLELEEAEDAASSLDLKTARDRLERDFIQQALARNKGKVARAAQDLGISRPALYELMEKHGIKRP